MFKYNTGLAMRRYSTSWLLDRVAMSTNSRPRHLREADKPSLKDAPLEMKVLNVLARLNVSIESRDNQANSLLFMEANGKHFNLDR